METVKIGVIGGSGLYAMDGLGDVVEVTSDTPFGKPSDAITVATLAGHRIAFLPRHGKGHRLLPTEVPSRANIAAFKLMGVEKIISFSAVGSLALEYAPRHFAVPTQLIGFTSDQLVPPQQLADLTRSLGGWGRWIQLPSRYGHDGFLKEIDALTPLIRDAVDGEIL